MSLLNHYAIVRLTDRLTGAPVIFINPDRHRRWTGPAKRVPATRYVDFHYGPEGTSDRVGASLPSVSGECSSWVTRSSRSGPPTKLGEPSTASPSGRRVSSRDRRATHLRFDQDACRPELFPLPSWVADRLARHMEGLPSEPDALLFTSARGLPVRSSASGHRLASNPRPPELPKTGMHALRHSAAARMISAAWSPKAVQQVLGHGSVAFTLTVYGHLFEDDLDALGEALVTGSRGFSADSGIR